MSSKKLESSPLQRARKGIFNHGSLASQPEPQSEGGPILYKPTYKSKPVPTMPIMPISTTMQGKSQPSLPYKSESKAEVRPANNLYSQECRIRFQQIESTVDKRVYHAASQEVLQLISQQSLRIQQRYQSQIQQLNLKYRQALRKINQLQSKNQTLRAQLQCLQKQLSQPHLKQKPGDDGWWVLDKKITRVQNLLAQNKLRQSGLEQRVSVLRQQLGTRKECSDQIREGSHYLAQFLSLVEVVPQLLARVQKCEQSLKNANSARGQPGRGFQDEIDLHEFQDQNEMDWQVRQIIELVRGQDLKEPLPVQIEKSGYLKNEGDGMYIFDGEGNAFRFDDDQLDYLVRKRIIVISEPL